MPALVALLLRRDRSGRLRESLVRLVALTVSVSLAMNALLAVAGGADGAPLPRDEAVARRARSGARSGDALPGGRPVRVFVVGHKQSLDDAVSVERFRAKIFALVDAA